MKYKFAITLFIVTIFFIGCNMNSKTDNNKTTIQSSENYIAIADTIITDVVIKNPNQDEWTEYCLRNLDKDELVENLFDLVYDGKLTPYNFFLDTEMTIDEVKAIEKEEDYERSKIGKVQFEEAWYFDKENQKMMKQVISIMIAYEIYDAEGNVKGYKPVFKVYFNDK